MSYTIKKSTGATLTEVVDQTINTTDSSLSLVGRGAIGYGQATAQNFIFLLENFANNVAPLHPIIGQNWYDTTVNLMKVYNGTGWDVAGGSGGTGSTSNAGGGTTLAGSTVSAPRTAGFTGVVLTNGLASSTVGVALSEGKVIHVTSHEAIPFASLPTTIALDGTNYVFKARFPSGLTAGITVANDANNYVIAGTATSAQYADLAERYASDEPLEAGDVVKLGGTAEVCKTQTKACDDVFGVVSTLPAFKMNSIAGPDETHPYIAMVGRVPVKCKGPVKKGQRLISSDVPGVAMGAGKTYKTCEVVGRALSDKIDEEIGLVEIVLAGVK